jgi:flagellar export protein FliJ
LRKFVFQLESALKYRRNMEEQETLLLVQARQKVATEESRAIQLKLEKSEHLNTYDPQRTSLTAMQQQEAYLSGLDFRIEKQLDKVDQAKKHFGVQRHKVVEASTKRKSLETLKEKSLDEHRSVVSKTEQIMLDDIGIAAYCHRVRI